MDVILLLYHIHTYYMKDFRIDLKWILFFGRLIFGLLFACRGVKGGENMAVKKEAATKLALKVRIEGADGKVAYSQRTFAHINPELSDENAYSIGMMLGALQSHEVVAVTRTDAAGLSE